MQTSRSCTIHQRATKRSAVLSRSTCTQLQVASLKIKRRQTPSMMTCFCSGHVCCAVRACRPRCPSRKQTSDGHSVNGLWQFGVNAGAAGSKLMRCIRRNVRGAERSFTSSATTIRHQMSNQAFPRDSASHGTPANLTRFATMVFPCATCARKRRPAFQFGIIIGERSIRVLRQGFLVAASTANENGLPDMTGSPILEDCP
jgi:hypothetical protein